MMLGGGSRTRTGDIRLAKPTLYQLSYAPVRARKAGSDSKSVCAKDSRSFLGGGASKLPPPCVAGSSPDGRAQTRPTDLLAN